jgi:hypothetical protein
MTDGDNMRRLVAQTRAAIVDCKRRIGEFRRTQREFWRNLAGDQLDEMLRSRAYAVQLLNSPHVQARLGALVVLSEHWKDNADLASEFMRVARCDPDEEVRAVALQCVGQCHQGTDDRDVGLLLARIVTNNREPARVRAGAYCALYTLRDLPHRWPGFYAEPPCPFRFPEDVDWSFVNSFLNSAPHP